MDKLLYKDLSYKLCGLAFQIDNEIGFGQEEKVYADALEKLLQNEKIDYKRELYCPITIDSEVVKKKYLDFLIDDKIVIELKVSNYNYRDACSQLFKYLKNNNVKLGLIFRFTRNGVKVKRIPNIQ